MSIDIGTKDTKEAIIALVSIVEFALNRLEDGADLEDLISVYSKLTQDKIFLKKVKDGFSGLNNISKEMSGISNEQIIALGIEVSPYLIPLVTRIMNKKD
jgi:hypothetical protein